MREIVIVISDLYFPAPETGPARETGPATGPDRASGQGAIRALPGFEHAARFGQKSAVEEGWRPWLARWLGHNDLAAVPPAVIAAAALSTVSRTPASAGHASSADLGATPPPNPHPAPPPGSQLQFISSPASPASTSTAAASCTYPRRTSRALRKTSTKHSPTPASC